MVNYYEVLEVSPRASQAVIRAAYKSLMQRYHPDKNNGDVDIAKQAILVGTAYEVLSNAESRAAYDVEINLMGSKKSNSAPIQEREAKPLVEVSETKNNFLTFFFILAGLLFLAIVINSQDKVRKEKQQEAQRIADMEYVKQAEADYAKEDLKSRTIENFAQDLYVKLYQPYGETVGHIIKIPKITIIVGSSDKERVIEYVKNNRPRLNQKLISTLVLLGDGKYSQLIKIDGEHYLRRLIQNDLNNEIGIDSILNYSGSDSRGVVDVLLPMSFSVHDTTN